MTQKKKMTWAEWERAERQDIPKLWRDMTDAEKGALLLAHHEGKEIEWNAGVGEIWSNCPKAVGRYSDYSYRIKPEPKKPREWWISNGYLCGTYERAQECGSVIIHVREVMGDEE